MLASFPSRLLLAAALLALPACHPHDTPDQRAKPPMSDFRTEKFYLSAAPASADGYPTRIIEGTFKRSDGQTFNVPNSHYLFDGWQGSAIGEVSGNEHQPAPDSLYLQWLSYAEDKFYEGRFQLPSGASTTGSRPAGTAPTTARPTPTTS